MSGNEFRFFLSCDINLPVTFRVERLEGNLPPAKSSDPGALLILSISPDYAYFYVVIARKPIWISTDSCGSISILTKLVYFDSLELPNTRLSIEVLAAELQLVNSIKHGLIARLFYIRCTVITILFYFFLFLDSNDIFLFQNLILHPRIEEQSFSLSVLCTLMVHRLASLLEQGFIHVATINLFQSCSS